MGGRRGGMVVLAAGISAVGSGAADLPVPVEVGWALLLGVGLALVHSRFRAGSEPSAEATIGPMLEEIERSRRYGHSCSVIRLAGAGGGAGDELRADVRARLRVTDRSWHDGTDVWVLLPECDRGAAQAYLGRLASHIPAVAELVTGSLVAVAAFPEDALTSGGLMDVLYGVAEEAAPNEALAPPAPIPFPVALRHGIAEAAG